MVAEKQLGEIITGVVEMTNDRGGIRIDGDWYQVSKFAKDVTMPGRGELVVLRLDSKAFVRSVERPSGAVGSPVENASVIAAHSGGRDRSITRMAVLKAAVDFLNHRPVDPERPIKADHIFTLAERMEAWVNRDEAGE